MDNEINTGGGAGVQGNVDTGKDFVGRDKLTIINNHYNFVSKIADDVVYNLIRKQRLDRIDEFLEILNEKTLGFEREILEQKMKTAEFIDLFEDGMWQVARALSRERKEYIASLLKNSLEYEDLNHIEQKKLLSLLNELNDAQIIILKSKEFLYQSEAQQAFYNLHREVLQPPLVTMQSSEEEADQSALYKALVNDLQRLELIETTFKKPKKNEFPEFDMKTGMVKAQSSRITRLGRLLLRYIDMEEKEEAEANP